MCVPKPVANNVVRTLRKMNGDCPIAVYTVQSPKARESAEKLGYWHGAKDIIEADRDFLEAYRWMTQQMSETISCFSGDYPIWATLHRPNFRHLRHWDEPMILVKAFVPRGRVLISDYDEWHNVLNKLPVVLNEEESDAWWELTDPQEQNAQLHWERIFDLEWLGEGRKKPRLQVCVDRIYVHEVERITVVNGRKRS